METKSIKEIQEEIIEEFAFFDDWMGKYDYLINLAKSLPVINEQFKTDENLINGCQSRVWLNASLSEGKVVFTAESDALITKGIVSLLIRVFSGHTPDEILSADTTFIDKIGLKEHLSPTRANGLLSMIKQMKFYALAFSTKIKK
ncbi:MAG: SufE family protein [Bacteroidota bacterium]|nr:SufE family protein [Bacteroidota bacterium]